MKMPSTEILAHWQGFDTARIWPIDTGLINLTFALQRRDGSKAILQRLHPVFSAEVNRDIDAVTRRLADQGLATPRLLPTRDGTLWVEAVDGVWRVLSYVEGIAHQRLSDARMAAEAGGLVGRFHLALRGFDYQYQSGRDHVHDTEAHLQRLVSVLEDYRGHRLYDQVAPLAERLLSRVESLCDVRSLPLRHAHGDLKISNLMFDSTGRGVCLIDLDTLTLMHWPLEMGDALRSWCNPSKEDQQAAVFELELFRAAIDGYRRALGDMISEQEWRLLVGGIERICLELSCRFLSDALAESYFGWDCNRYPSRGDHNLSRARAMWALYSDVRAKRPYAEAAVDTLLAEQDACAS